MSKGKSMKLACLSVLLSACASEALLTSEVLNMQSDIQEDDSRKLNLTFSASIFGSTQRVNVDVKLVAAHHRSPIINLNVFRDFCGSAKETTSIKAAPKNEFNISPTTGIAYSSLTELILFLINKIKPKVAKHPQKANGI